MTAEMKSITADQIFAIIDFINDESEYIKYEKSKSQFKKLVGTRDSGVVNEIGFLEIPNKYMNQEQYDWFIKRTTKDCKFAKGFIAILEYPLSARIRRINYQFPVLLTYIRNDDYDISLISVSAEKLQDCDLKVEEDIIISDDTEALIKLSELLSVIYSEVTK